MRDMAVYTLVVAKDGSKLKPTVEGKPGPAGPTPGSTRTNGSNGKFDMSGTGVPPTQLAAMLSQQLRRPVIDKTNLTDSYDFRTQLVRRQYGKCSDSGRGLAPRFRCRRSIDLYSSPGAAWTKTGVD